jgi:hypothetical protein
VGVLVGIVFAVKREIHDDLCLLGTIEIIDIIIVLACSGAIDNTLQSFSLFPKDPPTDNSDLQYSITMREPSEKLIEATGIL